MKVRLILYLCLLWHVAVQAQQVSYNFRHIGISDGLPDNYVKSVFGLPDGRLGVRTTVLLNLYDGKNFVSFPFANHICPIAYRSFIPTQYVDEENRLWLKERGALRLFDLNTEHFLSVDSVVGTWGLETPVSDLFVDSRKAVWLTDSLRCIYRYDSKLGKLVKVCGTDDVSPHLGSLRTLDVYGDSCWMVHRNGIIRCYDLEQRKFVRQEKFARPSMEEDSQYVIRMLDNGDFWLMQTGGIGYYNALARTLTMVPELVKSRCGALTGMDTDNAGNVWVGTVEEGLFVVDRQTLRVTKVSNLFTDGVSEKDASYPHGIYFDKFTSTLWIGFFTRGLACYHPGMNNLALYNHTNVSGNWQDEDIHSMLELDDGRILMGGQKGLFRYDPEKRMADVPYERLRGDVIRKLYKDSRGHIWVGTYRGGLFCIDGNRVTGYLENQTDTIEGNIRTLIEDDRGEIWVSVDGGIGRLNRQMDVLEYLPDRHPELRKYKLANAMTLDSKGRIVVGADNGLYVYDTKEDTLWIPEQDLPGSPLNTQGSNKCNCILRDSRGLIWLGTQYGIKVMDEDRNVDYLGSELNFSNTTVLAMQEDSNHDIWISTIDAIYRITIEQTEDGRVYRMTCLDQSKAQDWSGLYDFGTLKTRDGHIYFGKMNGFCMFVPENIVYTPCLRKPLFTGFRLFDKFIGCGEVYNGRVLFPKAIGNSEGVSLRHDEDFITLGFSGLNFVNPAQTYFRYTLEGLDKQWTETASDNGQGSITYSKIPPGRYVFRVQAAGNDHRWGPEARFVLTVRPPFWDTLWARAFYVICILAGMYGFVVYQRRKDARRIARLKDEEMARQREELNQMKFRFFTNVSHELRTPLTLILTPIEVLRKKVSDEKLGHQLDIIYKNAQELYALVNQLLDFRKVEMQTEKLHLSTGDIEETLVSIYTLFLPAATDKKLNFHMEVEDKHLYMYFDPDKLHRIVNNLLSNAFKFTPEGGSVTLSLAKAMRANRPFVRIAVSDTGIGIPEEQQAHIFERFYQVQNWDETKVGSGIGLHIVKEYVRIHEGEIEVSSQPESGTTFTVWLPMDLKPVEEKTEQTEAALENPEPEEEVSSGAGKGGKKKILLVEDNEDVRSFLKEQLEEEGYDVLDAPDGEAGEKVAIDENPDLIVSDIMMPKVDGIELCRRIKTNVQTSHIPIVLLTARTADDIKISSYEVGADSYIAKPFNFELLLVRIRKLIEQQEKRKQEFRRNIQVNPSVITITPLDEQLMQKALEYIEKNIDNPEYSVEALSRDMGMSRMNLYRKLQSITGHTPTEFIKTIRLKRAAQLLQGSQLTIVEVADRVGFSSSSYFTKCFKEQFGVLPTAYAAI